MQALFDLIHALAKEEKRLYNLHGRKGRFVDIYEQYLQQEMYTKQLDRDIYAKHFSKFSKAFYSMQKNALAEDILAVLLEYSNTSKPAFTLSRTRGKYEILFRKGFYDYSVSFLKTALSQARESGDVRQYKRVLEDYLHAIAHATTTTWEDYTQISGELDKLNRESSGAVKKELASQKLKVLVRSAKMNPGARDTYQEVAHDVVEDLRELHQENPDGSLETELFESEFVYSRTFEDKFKLHARLVAYEKESANENRPFPHRLQIINRLMENSMDCGDFLLINSLIYKTEREARQLQNPQEVPALAQFWSLAGMYHYYENDLQESQQNLNQVLAREDLSPAFRLQNAWNLVAVSIAANLPRQALTIIEQMQESFPSERDGIQARMLRLIIAVEMNQREDALKLITSFRSFLRTLPSPRRWTPYKNFLDMLQKHLQRKRVRFQEIPQLQTDWPDLFKPNLWLKAKMENFFYYNYILDYWQKRKQIVKSA